MAINNLPFCRGLTPDCSDDEVHGPDASSRRVEAGLHLLGYQNRMCIERGELGFRRLDILHVTFPVIPPLELLVEELVPSSQDLALGNQNNIIVVSERSQEAIGVVSIGRCGWNALPCAHNIVYLREEFDGISELL